MFDMFEYPTITSTNPSDQIRELQNYLVQFKETLEFILTNISTDNLSPELVAKLNDLGANIESNKAENEDMVQQITNRSITVSDVINSPLFKEATEVTLSVNYETGNLEYE
jgi:hypothetical protein